MRLLRLIGWLLVVLIAAAVGYWWFVLRGPDIPYAVLEAKYADAQSHFADLPGGVRLHYRDEGDRQAPVCCSSTVSAIPSPAGTAGPRGSMTASASSASICPAMG